MEFDAPIPPFIPQNPWKEFFYGFRVNIRNPYCAKLMRRYMDANNLPRHLPITDTERFAFEITVIPHLEKHFRQKAPAPQLPPMMRAKIPMDLLLRVYGVEDTDSLAKAVREMEQKAKE